MNQRQISWKDFIATIFTIAFPIALQNLLSTTAGMVDTIMIGSQGELSVAAVGICSQINSLFFACYWGFAGGGILFFSQYWGAKNKKGINETLGISMIFMLIVALAFAFAAITQPEWLLRIYTDKDTIIKTGIPYIRIVGFAYPIQVLAVLVSVLMRSTERVKPPLISSITALIVNFILNWILIYGRFGMPKMGAAGAAVGTLVSGIINLILLLFFLLRSKCEATLSLREMFHWDRIFITSYLSKCFPILCNEILYGIGQMVMNSVIGRQDESAIAAMAAFRVLEGFVFAFFGGLADASSVVVGKEVGAGKLSVGYQYVKRFSLLCPAITFTIVLIGVIFHHPLLSLFGLGPQALMYGKYMLYIYLVFGTIRTCNYIMNSCYRAGGEAVFGTVLEIVCLFTISVPATWIAGMVVQAPFLVIFAFLFTDEILRLIFEVRYTLSGKWVKPITPSGKEALPEFREWLKAR